MRYSASIEAEDVDKGVTVGELRRFVADLDHRQVPDHAVVTSRAKWSPNGKLKEIGFTEE